MTGFLIQSIRLVVFLISAGPAFAKHKGNQQMRSMALQQTTSSNIQDGREQHSDIRYDRARVGHDKMLLLEHAL